MADQPPGHDTKRARSRGRRWARRLLVAVVGLVVAVAAAALVAFTIAYNRPRPRVRGEVSLAGLSTRVEVIRDTHGVPHIFARTTADLFRALGYVHAQDRFWQMDFWRHVGSGRLAELFGPDLVTTDAFLRTLGWRQRAAAQHEETDPELRALLDAYADGVNAYIEPRAPSALAFEYTVLGLSNPGYAPEPWAPVHSITWGMAMAWDLRGNMDEEIERAVLLRTLSPEQVAQLYPPYPGDRHPYIVESSEEPEPVETTRLDSPGFVDALERLRRRAEGLDSLVGGGGEGIGSNSWVVSGDRSATGRPVLANDPHLGIRMPSIWYQVGLHCEPVSDQCPLDVVGFSFAGVPGVIIGHNAHIAWGLTNLGPDVMDLYIERLNPDDPNQYEVDGRWVDMQTRTETIRVAGGDAVEVTVRSTRHGPVVSDSYSSLRDFGSRAGIEVPAEHAIALRWTVLESAPSLVEAIYGLNTATGWQEFRHALRAFAFPSQNFVYADVEGNIGYQAPGRIPIRSQGDGRLPAPGWTSDHEWTGYIDFDDLPRELNPERGYIVTANNAVVGQDYPYLLTTDWAYGYRARRIVDLIEARQGLELRDHQEIQLDSFSLNADRVVPFVLDVEVEGRAATAARAVLASWDRRMDQGSAGAAIYAALWRRLLERAFHDDLPETHHPYGSGRWFEVVHRLLARPTDPFWNDRRTPETETRDHILAEALSLAVQDIESELGGPPGSWQWGRLHTADFVHETLGKSGVSVIEAIFNRTGFPVSGSSAHVNAAGWDAAEGFEVTWLPSMRMVVDLSDLGRSVAIHTTGQSGHPGHRHYDDLIPLWAEGRYLPMRWDRQAVEADAEGTLVLR